LLCQELQSWVAAENASRRQQRKPTIPRDTLGLRSREDYGDAAAAPRIATIYNVLADGQKGPGRVENGPFWMIQDSSP